jgi:hypothetical protein
MWQETERNGMLLEFRLSSFIQTSFGKTFAAPLARNTHVDRRGSRVQVDPPGESTGVNRPSTTHIRATATQNTSRKTLGTPSVPSSTDEDDNAPPLHRAQVPGQRRLLGCGSQNRFIIVCRSDVPPNPAIVHASARACRQRPVEPAGRVVLFIGVVVAAPTASNLVTAEPRGDRAGQTRIALHRSPDVVPTAAVSTRPQSGQGAEHLEVPTIGAYRVGNGSRAKYPLRVRTMYL